MTKQILNRDIMRLRKLFIKIYGNDRTEGQEEQLKAEFLRLYRADQKAEHLNANSLKTMMRINQAFRFIPFHSFFISLEF